MEWYILCLNPYSNGILSERELETICNGECVLILILMEYSLSTSRASTSKETKVLILILMEYSLSFRLLISAFIAQGLNPYSNGILSEFNQVVESLPIEVVLILILMEYSLSFMFTHGSVDALMS